MKRSSRKKWKIEIGKWNSCRTRNSEWIGSKTMIPAGQLKPGLR
jgi:hypothetical protein